MAFTAAVTGVGAGVGVGGAVGAGLGLGVGLSVAAAIDALAASAVGDCVGAGVGAEVAWLSGFPEQPAATSVNEAMAAMARPATDRSGRRGATRLPLPPRPVLAVDGAQHNGVTSNRSS